MLEREELTARAVAKSLGFADEAHFSRTFRAFNGQTLREFRRQNRARMNPCFNSEEEDGPIN